MLLMLDLSLEDQQMLLIKTGSIFQLVITEDLHQLLYQELLSEDQEDNLKVKMQPLLF